jgi:Rod binding domain-containing protein
VSLPVAPGGLPSTPVLNEKAERPTLNGRPVDPMVLKAAQGMEAMFLDYMLKTMRQTVPDNPESLNSPATKIYRGMLDSEYADIASRTGGVGLTQQIVDYLEGARYNVPRQMVKSETNEVSQSPQSTGGTRENSESKSD